MRQSALFTKTRREDPKDEVAKNARLLTRAGFIHKELAGVYSYLPLGLRVVEKINNIIREEMNALGAQEVSLSNLQDPSIWDKTDRWSDESVDVWFKTKLKNDTELGLNFTNEEPITRLAQEHIQSYRDLPASLYQIGRKFRNETRAKSGILRGREFLMKDLYSFHATEEDLNNFYEKVKQAYLNIFKRVGLGDHTYITYASGGVFSEFSHEFQTLCEAGEDVIYYSDEKKLAVNKEVYNDEVLNTVGLERSDLEEGKAIEVGNIFKLGTRFSEALDLSYLDESGKKVPVVMASYGIGPERVMGTVVEVLAKDNALVWPESIAPFKLHLIVLNQEEAAVKAEADKIYDELVSRGVEVLYDDRELSTGEKLGDADLLGLPRRVIVSKRNLEAGQVECKETLTGKTDMMTTADLYDSL
ncbi:MAG: prolyl-tRNA synthetase [Candidatus Pacebacteria bacterium]|nr:prolyl-tRNA synthetase [Candidatus Paceibacterota bacterium]